MNSVVMNYFEGKGLFEPQVSCLKMLWKFEIKLKYCLVIKLVANLPFVHPKYTTILIRLQGLKPLFLCSHDFNHHSFFFSLNREKNTFCLLSKYHSSLSASNLETRHLIIYNDDGAVAWFRSNYVLKHTVNI